MTLVERADHLRQIRQHFTACLTRGRQLVGIEGPIASGKTSLLREFEQLAREDGAVVLKATASRSEHRLRLGVITQLFEHSAISTEVTDHRLRLGDAEPALLQHITSTLTALCEEGPVVVTIDDVRHCDQPSFDCLLFLIRRLSAARILLLFTDTGGLQQTHPVLHAELVRQTDYHYVPLAPLSLRGVRDTIARELGDRTADALAERCRTLSGGNPLLTEALIKDYRQADAAAGVVPGEAFGRAVLTCLYGGEEVGLEVARVLAILDSPASEEVIGELVGVSPETVAHTIGALNAAGLLADGGFRDPAAQTAVLNSMTRQTRTAWHARAAELLHQHGAVTSVLVRHLLAADDAGPSWAVPVLVEAAQEASAGDDPSHAVDCLRLAHRACPDERTRAVILSSLVRAQWRVDPAIASRYLSELLAYIRKGVIGGPYTIVPIKYLLWHGRIDEVHEIFRNVGRSSSVGTGGYATELAATRAWLPYTYPELAARLERDDAGGPSEHLASVLMPAQGKAASALSITLRRGSDEEALTLADQMLKSASLDDATLGPIATFLMTLVYSDQLDQAAHQCDRLLREATERRAPTWQAILLGVRAQIFLRTGELPRAEKSAVTALTVISPASWGVLMGGPLASALMAATAMGKYDAASSYLKIRAPDTMLQTRYGLSYLQARGRYHLAVGLPHAALADFSTCGRLMARWHMDHPALVPWRADAAEAYLSLGDRDEARRLATEQLDLLQGQGGRWRGHSLRVLAAACDPPKRPPLLAEAVSLLEAADDKQELTAACMELSRTHTKLGDPALAATFARRARRLAEQCGSAEESTDTETDGPLDDPVPADRLSKAEHRVAVLATRGYTNQQISKKLYVTTSTVEQHLTRTYRKLGVRNRTELMQCLERSNPLWGLDDV